MAYYLAVRDEAQKMQHYNVPKEVYIYVRQLENVLKYEDSDMFHTKEHLKENYPGRFDVGYNFEESNAS